MADVGVPVGGGDIGMAQEFLDDAEVGAVFEEMGGKRVAEGVGRDRLGEADFGGVVFDSLPNADAAHAGAALGDEDGSVAFFAEVDEVMVEFLDRDGSDGNDALFPPFPLHTYKIIRHIADIEAAELRDAEA